MKALLSFVLVLCLGVAEAAHVWVFKSKPGSPPAQGYLILDQQPSAQGSLYYGGYRCPLIGIGYLFQGWWTDREGWHVCLVIDPEDPRIIGTVSWKDGDGVIDILSTDGVKGEIEITATLHGDFER